MDRFVPRDDLFRWCCSILLLPARRVGCVDPALRGDIAAYFRGHVLGHEHDAQAHGLCNALDGRQARIAFAALDLGQMLWRHARGNRDRFQRQMTLIALPAQG